MTASDLLATLADPAVAREVRRVLQLPEEPVAAALRDLAAAQARTEASLAHTDATLARVGERLDQLAAAQASTDASVKQLAAAQASTDASVKLLAAAQARTDAAVKLLAAAQASTDAAVTQLAAAQARTDATVARLGDRIDQLADAQARTEAAVQELAHEGRETRRALGALSDNVGFGLEELAAIVLPGVLQRDAHVNVQAFERRFLGTPQDEIELDLYAEGLRDGAPVIVAGEVKSRIYRSDVESFARRVRKALPDAGPTLVPVLFGFVVHPSARDAASRLGVHVIASRPGA